MLMPMSISLTPNAKSSPIEDSMEDKEGYSVKSQQNDNPRVIESSVIVASREATERTL